MQKNPISKNPNRNFLFINFRSVQDDVVDNYVNKKPNRLTRAQSKNSDGISNLIAGMINHTILESPTPDILPKGLNDLEMLQVLKDIEKYTNKEDANDLKEVSLINLNTNKKGKLMRCSSDINGMTEQLNKINKASDLSASSIIIKNGSPNHVIKNTSEYKQLSNMQIQRQRLKPKPLQRTDYKSSSNTQSLKTKSMDFKSMAISLIPKSNIDMETEREKYKSTFPMINSMSCSLKDKNDFVDNSEKFDQNSMEQAYGLMNKSNYEAHNLQNSFRNLNSNRLLRKLSRKNSEIKKMKNGKIDGQNMNITDILEPKNKKYGSKDMTYLKNSESKPSEFNSILQKAKFFEIDQELDTDYSKSLAGSLVNLKKSIDYSLDKTDNNQQSNLSSSRTKSKQIDSISTNKQNSVEKPLPIKKHKRFTRSSNSISKCATDRGCRPSNNIDYGNEDSLEDYDLQKKRKNSSTEKHLPCQYYNKWYIPVQFWNQERKKAFNEYEDLKNIKSNELYLYQRIHKVHTIKKENPFGPRNKIKSSFETKYDQVHSELIRNPYMYKFKDELQANNKRIPDFLSDMNIDLKNNESKYQNFHSAEQNLRNKRPKMKQNEDIF